MAKRTTTAYLILGLLATRDWSAYALAEQLGKGVTELWPRADRQMYNAPKRLVEEGLVTARKEKAEGSRLRTVYSITDAGHQALQEWLATQSAPPALEFEGMIRVLLAGEGTLDDLRGNLETMAEHARESRQVFVKLAEFLLETEGGTIPQDRHLFGLANRFMVDHFTNILEWAEWAQSEIATWPDTTTPAKTHQKRTVEMLERSVRLGQETDPEA